MITDMDGARESSTCRSDPFVTDLHNALIARAVRFFYGLSANHVLPRCVHASICSEIHWTVRNIIYQNKVRLRFFVLLLREGKSLETIKLSSVRTAKLE